MLAVAADCLCVVLTIYSLIVGYGQQARDCRNLFLGFSLLAVT